MNPKRNTINYWHQATRRSFGWSRQKLLCISPLQQEMQVTFSTPPSTKTLFSRLFNTEFCPKQSEPRLWDASSSTPQEKSDFTRILPWCLVCGTPLLGTAQDSDFRCWGCQKEVLPCQCWGIRWSLCSNSWLKWIKKSVFQVKMWAHGQKNSFHG